MPLYIDIHDIEDGTTAEALADAHAADVGVQAQHGVEYHKYWWDAGRGKLFCLCTAPDAEAADRVHREAHGFSARKIIEVHPDLAEGFLGGGQVGDSGAVFLRGGTERDPGVRTVMFTDIVNSTDLTQRMGDEAAMAFIRVHDTIVRNAVAARGGREIKHTGDGIMAAFVSAVMAVRCGTRIQHDFSRHGERHPETAIQVRIGAAAGEPVEQGDDLFGSTVQLASRLCGHAAPGQVLVSTSVAELCIGKGIRFHEAGRVKLKGFDEPVLAHAVAMDV